MKQYQKNLIFRSPERKETTFGETTVKTFLNVIEAINPQNRAAQVNTPKKTVRCTIIKLTEPNGTEETSSNQPEEKRQVMYRETKI